MQDVLRELEEKIASVGREPESVEARLRNIRRFSARSVLTETAKLHEGDPENLRLWREFMPPCLAAIEQIYGRLHVTFDHTLGESFYHDRLAAVVAELQAKGLARESEGAALWYFSGRWWPADDHPQKRRVPFCTPRPIWPRSNTA